jgi:hypothetical protein
MKAIPQSFEKNANQTGLHLFVQRYKDVFPTGKICYIYERVWVGGPQKGKTFAFEVFIPTVKKAGTYKVPGGGTISYDEDFEEYPGKTKFGRSAACCKSMDRALGRLEEWKKNAELIVEAHDEDEKDDDEAVEYDPTVKRRGRPRKARPAMTVPEGVFNVQQLADLNSTTYINAYLFLKAALITGTIKFEYKKRTNPASPVPTKYYSKVSQQLQKSEVDRK